MEKHNHSSYGGVGGAIETHTMNAFIQSPFMQWVSDIRDIFILTYGFFTFLTIPCLITNIIEIIFQLKTFPEAPAELNFEALTSSHFLFNILQEL